MPHRVPATLEAIQAKWKEMLGDRPFSYYFLDEFFDRQYRSEENFGRLFLNFAILAIFISCLGLMGLAAYSIVLRTKEIGVRKVVGASVGNIVYLLSRDFLLLVGWAFLVAAPLAWFFVHGWLDGFAYRITSYWWIFALAGVAAIGIALGAVSFQAIKAALVNPVKSLKNRITEQSDATFSPPIRPLTHAKKLSAHRLPESLEAPGVLPAEYHRINHRHGGFFPDLPVCPVRAELRVDVQ